MQNSSLFIRFSPSVQRFPPNTVQIWKILGSFSVQDHFLHEPELFDRIRCSLTKILRHGRGPLSFVFGNLKFWFWMWFSCESCINFAVESILPCTGILAMRFWFLCSYWQEKYKKGWSVFSHVFGSYWYGELKNKNKNAIFDFWFLVSLLERPKSGVYE